MVHALEIVHKLLKKDGLFIDIHPSGRPPRVEVHNGGQIQLAGHLEETNDFVEYAQADEALKQVTNRGLFQLESQGLFDFLLHAPTIEALAGHLEAEWLDAILPEAVVERLATLLDDLDEAPIDDKEIIVRENIGITRFRADGL